mmetsp:Transcript_3050/g.6764  ORF Transcript_3050/g.6764 Transcript_3050/m.6764 type:complete len:244 (-) Transcript_3050:466-1197(-)
MKMRHYAPLFFCRHFAWAISLMTLGVGCQETNEGKEGPDDDTQQQGVLQTSKPKEEVEREQEEKTIKSLLSRAKSTREVLTVVQERLTSGLREVKFITRQYFRINKHKRACNLPHEEIIKMNLGEEKIKRLRDAYLEACKQISLERDIPRVRVIEGSSNTAHEDEDENHSYDNEAHKTIDRIKSMQYWLEGECIKRIQTSTKELYTLVQQLKNKGVANSIISADTGLTTDEMNALSEDCQNNK